MDSLSTKQRPRNIFAVLMQSHRIRCVALVVVYFIAMYYFLSSTQSRNIPFPSEVATPRKLHEPDNGHGLSHVDISPLEDRIVKLIDTHKVMVFSKSYCPYSAGAKKLLMSYTLDFNIMEVDLEDDDKAIKDVLIKVSHGHSTFPSVFLKGVSIGGFDKLDAMDREGKLKPYLEQLGVELER